MVHQPNKDRTTTPPKGSGNKTINMANSTEERCIYVMAEMHPYTLKEISDVFKRCGSIDKTIAIIYRARQTKTTLIYVCELIGI